jgi:hypothetical protein
MSLHRRRGGVALRGACWHVPVDSVCAMSWRREESHHISYGMPDKRQRAWHEGSQDRG